ncbi:hypothetical protein F5141DRAFT_1096187 [Pisolithus sp. B1]|nr:hypothetical protein F5141DRAFT_1096187 [Pisolithus sp. B1]
MSVDLPKTWIALVPGPPPETTMCIPVRDTHIADTGSLADITSRSRRLLDFWRPSLNVSFIDPKSIIGLGLAEVLERLVDFVKALPDILNDPSNWIRGMGWEHAIWAVPVSAGVSLPFAFKSQSDPGSN